MNVDINCCRISSEKKKICRNGICWQNALVCLHNSPVKIWVPDISVINKEKLFTGGTACTLWFACKSGDINDCCLCINVNKILIVLFPKDAGDSLPAVTRRQMVYLFTIMSK